MSLVQSVKEKLQDLRKKNGWDELVEVVNGFCTKHDIIIPNLEDNPPTLFHTRVIDRIGEEMKSRFGETSTKLLICVASLDPRDSFSHFSESKLHRLVESYPQDFLGIEALAQKIVEIGLHNTFRLLYRLIELPLHVATATIKRAFFAMSIVKTKLRNKMGAEFIDSLMCYVEKDLFKTLIIRLSFSIIN
ncbi:LOW QUALITY PROTEIN: hypothetical protein V2J09_010677 [Rumex salicifolius]